VEKKPQLKISLVVVVAAEVHAAADAEGHREEGLRGDAVVAKGLVVLWLRCVFCVLAPISF
jgi:hypothetical protein